MEIYINGDKINFSLENETNLLEVIEGIEQWIGEKDMVISEIDIDGNHFFHISESEFKNKPINEIDLLHITLKPGWEHRFNNLEVMYNYFSVLQEALSKEDISTIKDLMQEYLPIRDNIDNLINGNNLSGGNLGEKIDSLFKQTGISEYTLPSEEDKGVLLDTIDTIKSVIFERLKEIAEPIRSLKETAKELSKLTPEIQEISVMFQTGEDREAMQKITVFTEYLQKLIRTFPLLSQKELIKESEFVIGDTGIEEFYTSMNSILVELVEAFQNDDFVLVGDLLEYEIAPKTESLITFLEKLEIKQT